MLGSGAKRNGGRKAKVPRKDRARTHGPREVLNELKWHRRALERALVHYVHRPEGERVVEGAHIRALGPDSFERATRSRWRPGRIPYHRVTRIELDGETIWERRPREGQ